jgi:peptide/nickel transport system permease protein
VWVYALKRALLLVPTLLGIVTVVFVVNRVLPGNPIQLMIPPNMSGQVQASFVRHLMAIYGFDRPLYIQYVDYLWQIVRLNFGNSLQTGLPILPQVLQHLGYTAQLGVLAALFSLAIGLPAGIISAVRRDTAADYTMMLIALGGVSIPTFVLGYVLIYLFGLVLGILPPSGFNGPIWTLAGLPYAILPAFTLGAGGAGYVARFARSAMLEVMQSDHVRTARAKGVDEWTVVRRHVLRNSWIPVLTAFGLQVGYFLSGAVIVENIFGWPGVGQYIYNGINNRDFPVIQAGAMFVAALFVLVNLLTDLAYAGVDPRIRYD